MAVAIRDRCLNIWAATAVGLVHAYDPEMIVIGGGVMKSADLIIPYLESYVHKYAWTLGARFKSAPPNWGTMPCLWEHFRFCHKTSQPMNKRLDVFEVYLDADWRSHERCASEKGML